MDPIANINRQRELAPEIIDALDANIDREGNLPDDVAQHVAELANELAELVQALDEWRRKGGFDPYAVTR